MRVPLRILTLLLLLALGGLAAPSVAEAAPKRLTVQEQYEQGLRYMNRGYYTKALETLNRIRNYHRDDPLSVKAELAIADVYYKKDEYDQARLAYEDFMRMHPRHPDLDYVVYRIGLSLYKRSARVAARDQTWTRQAVTTWSGFTARFPASTYRGDVDKRLTECRERLARKELLIARFYQRRAAWGAVEGRSRGLVTSFPDSAHVPESLHLLALSRAWQGDPEDALKVVEKLRETEPAAADRLSHRISRIPQED